MLANIYIWYVHPTSNFLAPKIFIFNILFAFYGLFTLFEICSIHTSSKLLFHNCSNYSLLHMLKLVSQHSTTGKHL